MKIDITDLIETEIAAGLCYLKNLKLGLYLDQRILYFLTKLNVLCIFILCSVNLKKNCQVASTQQLFYVFIKIEVYIFRNFTHWQQSTYDNDDTDGDRRETNHGRTGHFAEVKWANKKILVNGLRETREEALKLFWD